MAYLTPKSYLTTFVAGMAFGFALGVAATRTRASGLDLDYVITAPMCPQYSSQSRSFAWLLVRRTRRQFANLFQTDRQFVSR